VDDDFTLIQFGYTYISEDSSKVLHTVKPMYRETLIPSIFSNNLGPPISVSISRSLWQAAGVFDENLKSVEDWDYWLRVAKSGATLKQIPIPLVYYRYAKNSMSRNAFVMYDALKTVIQRGPQFDSRITVNCPQNKNYNFNTQPILQQVLIRSIGVSIMQGKIVDSIDLFLKETKQPIFDYLPLDFEPMCSYLTFRYWYSQDDINEVFKVIYPRFALFFKKAGYDSKFTKKTLNVIFKRHIQNRNINKYGNTIGKFKNLISRNFNQYL
jgi:hypothetical protein